MKLSRNCTSEHVLRELSLFSGAGGGLLGTKLLGWETIGYVEINDYCQRILNQRILDGIFNKAPIFGDVDSFISEGYAGSYKGMVDVITAGFPCQPFSYAGNRKGEADKRNMWPQTKDCIGIIRPKYCFLENVPGILTHKYIKRIFGDLAQMGYDCRWGVIGGGDLGFYTKRDRVWIVCWDSQVLSYVYNKKENFKRISTEIKFRLSNKFNRISDLQKNWDASVNGPFGVDNGLAYNVGRIEAIGNGQIPAVVRAAWEVLTN